MNNKKLLAVAATGISALGSAALIYGALVESKRLVVDRIDVPLEGLPSRLDGYRIAVLADFHIGHRWSIDLAQQAIDLALDESPDMVALVGDYVSYWDTSSPAKLGEILEPLLMMNGNVVAVPGNHDYRKGSPEILRIIFDELNIKLLRNENWTHDGICWVGIDSYNADHANVAKAFLNASEEPKIVLSLLGESSL
jgi:predicted MPP superfamily phosphohydrolase